MATVDRDLSARLADTAAAGAIFELIDADVRAVLAEAEPGEAVVKVGARDRISVGRSGSRLGDEVIHYWLEDGTVYRQAQGESPRVIVGDVASFACELDDFGSWLFVQIETSRMGGTSRECLRVKREVVP